MRGMTVEERDLDPKKALGQRIKQARKERRLSAVAAGQAAGISREWWGRFEAGERRDGEPFKPEPSTIIKVVNVVGIDPAEALRIFEYDPDNYEDSLDGRPTTSRQQLIANTSRLDDTELQAVSNMVDVILRAKNLLSEETPTKAAPAKSGVEEGVKRDASSGVGEAPLSDNPEGCGQTRPSGQK